MKKLLLIDGSGLLFQSFYGMPSKIKNSKGEYIEAVICFMGILRKTLDIIKPDYLQVVFDGENQLERREIDEGYKANRKNYSDVEEVDNPFCQLSLIQKVLKECKIKFVETVDCEGDDMIAGISNSLKDKVQVIISSCDKDFLQCIDDNISVFTYRGKKSEITDKQSFIEKYSFSPKSFSLYKALVGDSSDNIKGLEKIGKVTATKIVKKFGNIENLLNNLNLVENDKIKEIIKNNQVKLIKNHQMIDLSNKLYEIDLKECGFLYYSNTNEILKKCEIL